MYTFSPPLPPSSIPTMCQEGSLGLGCCTPAAGTIYSITDISQIWYKLGTGAVNECKTFLFGKKIISGLNVKIATDKNWGLKKQYTFYWWICSYIQWDISEYILTFQWNYFRVQLRKNWFEIMANVRGEKLSQVTNHSFPPAILSSLYRVFSMRNLMQCHAVVPLLRVYHAF